ERLKVEVRRPGRHRRALRPAPSRSALPAPFSSLRLQAIPDRKQGAGTMTHRTWRIAIVALPALCGLALAPVAGAHGGAEQKDTQFQMMDANGDGKISAEEHAAGAKKMFQMMDADNDGH